MNMFHNGSYVVVNPALGTFRNRFAIVSGPEWRIYFDQFFTVVCVILVREDLEGA